jgi:anti-sigma regulatory factor (Ser/Thr protein kinase)
VANWTLAHDPLSASEARQLTVDRLTGWGLGDLVFSAELIVSELVTNAVRYAKGTIGLRLIRDDMLIFEVTDSTSAAPHLRLADDSDEGGRGLYLVGRVARRWGTRHSSQGKTVWAELPLP